MKDQQEMGLKRTHKVKRIKISQSTDIAKAVTETKILTERIGFEPKEQFMVATAVSELARNIHIYAKKGEVTLKVLDMKGKKGIEVIAKDQGPGIKDVGKVLQGGYSTSGGLGIGLSGAKRLMDEFLIDTKVNKGTKIKARKWV